jgi:hypothetical protein
MYIYTKQIDQDLQMKIHANPNNTYSVSAWDSEINRQLDVVYIFKTLDAAMEYVNAKKSNLSIKI